MIRLNGIKPAAGSKKKAKRLGRGIGCGRGKTCGKGHKGQHARAGGYHKLGFEGGQMPLQRRLPKFGFKSRKGYTLASLRLSDLRLIDGEMITLEALYGANLISKRIKSVRIFLSGSIERPLKIAKNIKLTEGAKAAIVAVGGAIESE